MKLSAHLARLLSIGRFFNMSILREAIEKQLKGTKLREITQSFQQLSSQYREKTSCSHSYMGTSGDRLSYLATRMPATCAAAIYVMRELQKRCNALALKSMLDLGAGPGTLLWASIEAGLHLEQVTLLERDRELVVLGKKLAEDLPFSGKVVWQLEDLGGGNALVKHDLVTMSYSLGEMGKREFMRLLASAWEATGQLIIVIEPGTPRGFQTVLEARRFFIDAGGYLVAPCPHAHACPMEGTSDWCHFSTRVERSSVHRLAKGGSLGYEDEKFSYVIMGKNIHPHRAQARIVRTPKKKSGHVILNLCTSNGLEERTISRRELDLYPVARKSTWGDDLSSCK